MTAVPGARTAGAELKNDILICFGDGRRRWKLCSPREDSCYRTDVLAIEIACLELKDHTYA
jgi:hypothetical protein